jgi:hypothetical protein
MLSMANHLLTNRIWDTITPAVRRHPFSCRIAVAYFGSAGAKMLPLKKGSKLVVNASESAVKSGQTNPSELLKLYKKGVRIFSFTTLHAKVFYTVKLAFVGSANVSGRSANVLQEAVMQTNERKHLTAAYEFVESLCHHELGKVRLSRLSELYRPPKLEAIKGRNSKVPGQRVELGLRVVNLTIDDEPEGIQRAGQVGAMEAKRHSVHKSRHRIERFWWVGNAPFERGEQILQIVSEGRNTWVYPPGTVIHKKSARSKRGTRFTHVYVEGADKNRRNLEKVQKQLGGKDGKLLNRGGRKSREFTRTLISLWR